MANSERLKNSILVAANYNSPTEKFCVEENGNCWTEEREGREVFDKTIELSCDYSIVSEFRFDGTDYMEEKLGKIVDDGRIYDLDDIDNIDKLEALLKGLEQKEKDIKSQIDASIAEDLQERE